MISIEEYRNNVRIEKENAHRSWHGLLGKSVILWFLSPRITAATTHQDTTRRTIASPHVVTMTPCYFLKVRSANRRSFQRLFTGPSTRPYALRLSWKRLSSSALYLFWMWNDVFDTVRVAGNSEIKTPFAVHPCLPEIRGLVIFLSAKRRVQEVAFEEAELFVKRALDSRRRILQRLNCTVGQNNFHGREGLRLPVRRARISLRRNLTASSAVSNGPWYGPLRASDNLASIVRRSSAEYSSVAGGFAVIVITPPLARNSNSAPRANPARRCTAGGTIRGVLFLTVTVMDV
jgi:hypothetical protein